MNEIEKRFMQGEVRVVEGDGAPKLVGYAAVFESYSQDLGGFIEKIKRGAFARTLKNGADVRAVINHDANLILGRSSSGTLRMAEDDTGLRFEVDLPDTQYARDLLVSVKRGDISGCSFMFRTVADVWEQKKDALPERTLEDVDLMDVGPVTYPAYPETTVFARAKAEEMKNLSPDPSLIKGGEEDGTGEAGAAPTADGQLALERLGTLRVKLTILKEM